MALSVFDDKSRRPRSEQVNAALGPAANLWRQLIAHAAEQDSSVDTNWHFSGSKYGWSLRVNQENRVILHMTPCKGHFLAGVVLGEKTVAAAQTKGLPKPVLAALEAAPRYAEGRGIRRKVSTVRELRLVMRLVDLKMSPGARGQAETAKLRGRSTPAQRRPRIHP